MINYLNKFDHFKCYKKRNWDKVSKNQNPSSEFGKEINNSYLGSVRFIVQIF